MRRWRERLESDGYSGLADRRKGLVVDIAVKGMTCPFCAYGLEKNLGKASEVDHASASLKGQNVRIVLKPGAQADLDRYKQLIHDAGFTPGEAKVSKEEAK